MSSNFEQSSRRFSWEAPFVFRDLFRHVARSMALMADQPYIDAMGRAVEVLGGALGSGHQVLVFGNGGSSADAQHIAAELVGRFTLDRDPLRVIALGTNSALFTAWSNDRDHRDVFAREVKALGRPGDVAWGISTSGTSPNVLGAFREARAAGLKTIGLTGQGGEEGEMARLCDVLMAVPLLETPRIQEVHLVTYHAICAELERRMFNPGE